MNNLEILSKECREKKKVKVNKEVEKMVKLSLHWGYIEEQLEALQWKNSIKAVENNLLKGI